MDVCLPIPHPPLTLAFPLEIEKIFEILLFFGSLACFSECDCHADHKAACVFVGLHFSFLNLGFH